MGEFELLARIEERLGRGSDGRHRPAEGSRLLVGAGDDAAVTAPGGVTATSVDALIDGVHFERERISPRDIGHKALAAALSDLAAMGAAPGEAYLVLGVPEDLSEDRCLEIADGAAALAERTGTAIAGGDITRAGRLFLAVTVVGHAGDASGMTLRSGARPGQLLVLTGELGGAAAGLHLLRAPGDAASAAGLSAETAAAMIGRQQRPEPRLKAGRALAASGAGAMIDLSDGLGADALHMAEASGARLEVDLTRVRLCAGLEALAAADGRDPLEWAASGGEDYELLAAIDADRLPAAAELLGASPAGEGRFASGPGGESLTVVGRVAAGEGVLLRAAGGREVRPRGFDQLAKRERG